MLKEVTFVVTCMGRLAHLKQTLPLLATVAPVVVVDYSCPDKAGQWVVDAGLIQQDVVRVISVPDQKFFNMARARNEGAKSVRTEWVGFFDADMIVQPGFAEEVGKWTEFSNAKVWLGFHKRSAGFAGFIVCRSVDYLAVDGFDEAATGYGYEDCAFKEKLAHICPAFHALPIGILKHIPHSDAERVKHFENKNKEQTYQNNVDLLTRKVEKFKREH